MINVEAAVKEGARCAFENNAYEHCDGKDDPEDRCPSEGHCVCVYKRWHEQPWWKRLFKDPPPRPSEKTVQDMVFGRMIEQALENIKEERKQRAKYK